MAEYIEREAVLFEMDDYFNGTNPDGDEQIGVLKMRRLVRTYPAADVAPVVHGRWIEKEEPYFDVIYDCSACGESFCFIEGNPSNNLYNYCPNCGARMDGDG